MEHSKPFMQANLPIKLFLSFGPNCLAADILKSCELRKCTYGFDWFRSGSWHHKEFLRLPIEIFLAKYVYAPCLPLIQGTNPKRVASKTVELSAIKPVYGYQVLYNPHRPLYERETNKYFERCFRRLDSALNSKSEVNILLADYTNKPGSNMIPNYKKCLEYLSSLLIMNNRDATIHLCKVTLSDSLKAKLNNSFSKRYWDINTYTHELFIPKNHDEILIKRR